MFNEQEIWKPIPSFPGYEISDLGNVRSWLKGHGTCALANTPHLMKPQPKLGYSSFCLFRDGKKFYKELHCLMLETFVGPCPDGMEGCHNDDNRGNNSLDNLRWDTHKANYQDQIKNGHAACGERHYCAILTTAQVIEIRERYAAGESSISIRDSFHISVPHINTICGGRRWKHVGGPKSNTHSHAGQNNGRATLTESDVLAIREQAALGVSYPDLARYYNVSAAAIGRAAAGKTWKHIGGPITLRQPYNFGANHWSSR